MTPNRYIIDASSLIELHRHNPMDVYPSVWKNIESLIKNKVLIAPKEVLHEIEDSDDQLANWVKQHADLFREPTEKQLEILSDILNKFPAIVKEERKHDADAWVIAQAVEMKTDSQKTLVPVETIVVTEEKIRGNQIKIPYVCEKYSIKSIDILELFRIEGWKF